LLSVGEIAGQAIAQAPGPVTQRLHQAFDAFVSDYISRRIASRARA
jgi:hypothetical protein